MRFIAILAVLTSSMIATGLLTDGPVIMDQSFTMIASIIAGAGFAYVLGRG